MPSADSCTAIKSVHGLHHCNSSMLTERPLFDPNLAKSLVYVFLFAASIVHQRMASMPLRLMMFSIASAGPVGRFAPRSSWDT